MDDSAASEGVAEAITDAGSEDSTEVTTEQLEQVAQPQPEPKDEDSAKDQTEEGDQEEEQEEEVEEYREFNVGGKKLSVLKSQMPDELADEIQQFAKNIESGFTKKSQAVAEQVKSLEVQQASVQKLNQMQGETLDTYSKGLQLKSELEQLNEIDINALWQSDPDQARRISDAVSQKQAEFNSTVQKVTQNEQAFQQAQKDESARFFTEGKQKLEKLIKGFGAKAPEVVDYVVNTYGLDRKTAEATWPNNPPAAVMAYKAMLFDRLQSKANKGTKPKPVTAQAVKPIKGKGGGKVNKDPGKMEPEEYRAFRTKQKRAATG